MPASTKPKIANNPACRLGAFVPDTPALPARGVAATCPAWDRVIAGATPAALTHFQFPDDVKVAWRTVNPLVLVRVQVREPFVGHGARAALRVVDAAVRVRVPLANPTPFRFSTLCGPTTVSASAGLSWKRRIDACHPQGSTGARVSTAAPDSQALHSPFPLRRQGTNTGQHRRSQARRCARCADRTVHPAQPGSTNRALAPDAARSLRRPARRGPKPNRPQFPE